MDSKVASHRRSTCSIPSSASSSDDDTDLEGDSPLITDAMKLLRKGEDDGSGNFLQRYFQHHSTSLPSRMAAGNRRLSQCREEDEDEEKRELKEPVPSSSNMSTISGSDKSLSESSSGSKASVIDTVTGPTHKFVITRARQPKERQPSEVAKEFARSSREYRQSNTVNFPPTETKRPSVYNVFRSPIQSPHYDHRFFDSSLIEMKSQTSSSSTIDYGSTEDIWVRRTPADLKRVSDGYRRWFSPLLDGNTSLTLLKKTACFLHFHLFIELCYSCFHAVCLLQA